jgi:hypothetical protein
MRAAYSQPPAYWDPAASRWDDHLPDHIAAEGKKLARMLLDSDRWLAVVHDNDREVQAAVVRASRHALNGDQCAAGYELDRALHRAAKDCAQRAIESTSRAEERLVPASEWQHSDLGSCT